MSYSASSTNNARFGRLDRAIARLLIAAILGLTPVSAWAGDEFQDANNTTFNDSVVSLDNSLSGQTTFTLDTNRATIGWQDLQQPNGNTLEFNFTDLTADSIVLNTIGAYHPSNLNGTLISNGTVVFANPFGIFIGNEAVIDVGGLVAIAGDVSPTAFMAGTSMLLPLTGTVENNGIIRAEGNVSLFGRTVVNNGDITVNNGDFLAYAGEFVTSDSWDFFASEFDAPRRFWGVLGEGRIENNGTIKASNGSFFGGQILNTGDIEIADGTLLMIAADAVWVTEFDNPVLIKVPNASSQSDNDGEVQYAIENHGRIAAGLGHIRLAASDPLGFAIRQGTGSGGVPASIAAQHISIEGGETGRVHLSGEINATNLANDGIGGEIDITGQVIVLEAATINASGIGGGGTIQIGGEQEGHGDLQRASVTLVDVDTEIRADAIRDGDGGKVIVFAEDITSVDGAIYARGGAEGGNGGFVETSGLRNFAINHAPDVSAAFGTAGSWLIDPFNITIANNTPPTEPFDCVTAGAACLNAAILAILDPDFDTIGFDGILRTVNPDNNSVNANFVSAELIATALAVGTSVTLSTQAFGLDRGTDDGDITILEAILIDSDDVLAGTTAQLTLLAAGDINVMESIEVLLTTTADPADARANLALSVVLRANDSAQQESDQDFAANTLEGDVILDAAIRTRGGDVTLSGSSVLQSALGTIETEGGSVSIFTGTVDEFGRPISIARSLSDTPVDPLTPAPRLELLGTIDTSNPSGNAEDGGDVTLAANSISVTTIQSSTEPVEIFTGELIIADQIRTGGGDVRITGDGSIDIDADITTNGGTLSIGNASTQSIHLDGDFNTLNIDDATENGLIQLVALDSATIDLDADIPVFGDGQIVIGETNATTLSTSRLVIESRDVSFSNGAGVNVSIVAAGSSTAVLPEVGGTATATTTTTGESATTASTSGQIDITGSHRIDFNENTQLMADSILISAATRPTDLNATDPVGASRLTRLTFGGLNGAGQAASDGVRLNADVINISVGDGTTASDTLFSQDLGTSNEPTEFGLQRLTRGSYEGLQLRDTAGGNRPEELQIVQDGDFTITNLAPTADSGEINLSNAFDGLDMMMAAAPAIIGSQGLRTTLESSDGVLTVLDAAALNNALVVDPGSDSGKSFLVLNGGHFLPDSPDEPTDLQDTVVFGNELDGPLVGASAFDVESLTVSTPGNFTIDQRIIDSIASANELVFEAGRNTGISGVAGRGTLTVAAGITLQANDRLALLAGATGFGDLMFSGAGITLAANDIELRAGGGAGSLNTVIDDRSKIDGLQSNNVTIRDANSTTFGDTDSEATAFSFRQDAAIDAQNNLPDLDQFGLITGTGFRPEVVTVAVVGGVEVVVDVVPGIEYEVRSDQGNIDLDDGVAMTNEGERFYNAALTLVGVDSSNAPAIDVSADFEFVGKKVTLGAIGDFSFTQELANAFNRNAINNREQITLHSGLGVNGDLSFDRGGDPFVVVAAPRIDLIAGSGFAVDEDSVVISISEINVDNAMFDLLGPIGSVPTLTFHTGSDIALSDLPTVGHFVNGLLPKILGIRSDFGNLSFLDFDIGDFAIDISGDPADPADDARLILEALSISLEKSDGTNLRLTDIDNLNLRLRTNFLTLNAANSNVDEAAATDAADRAQVFIGSRAGDNPATANPALGRTDSTFDDESLIIEAFDSNSTSISAGNLSSLSEVDGSPRNFALEGGRGPTMISLTQDREITPAEIFSRTAVSGQLERSISDDDDGGAIATRYSLTSTTDTVTFNPDNVNGSSLVASGSNTDDPLASGILFGEANMPGIFEFASVTATSASAIIIQDGTQITATDFISLGASVLTSVADDPGEDFGDLSFGTGALTTSLTANLIFLIAGPQSTLTEPDGDDDGDEPDLVKNMFLPKVDLTNLDEVILNGETDGSLFSLRQSASLDMATSEADFLTPLEAGISTNKWETIRLRIVQGGEDVVDLVVNELDRISALSESLVAETRRQAATLIVNVPSADPNPMIPYTPFDDFSGSVEFRSNDMTFRTEDLNTSINLASDKLLLLSTLFPVEADTEEQLEQLARLRSDPDVLDRAIVRIEQVSDFTSTELPRPEQYFTVDEFGQRAVRGDLSNLDIELTTTGASTTLTLDDNIRARVTGSNLILNSAADVDILLTGATPGFDGLDFAALQLASLEINTDTENATDPGSAGTITIRPFTDTSLTIETTGDQKFDGDVILENTLATTGRDIRFTRNVNQDPGGADSGLTVSTSGKVTFEGNIGSNDDGTDDTGRLDHLLIAFDTDTTTRTPSVAFGERTDSDGDGIFETPVPDTDPQEVNVINDIVFTAFSFEGGDRSDEIQTALAGATVLSSLAGVFSDRGFGRTRSTPFATIGKADGDLTFDSTNGNFVMTSGEKLAVGGTATINATNADGGANGGLVSLGDVAAIDLNVTASEIGLVRRAAGNVLNLSGQTQEDGGSSILANTIAFNGVTPVEIGSGERIRFGLPNPFDVAAVILAGINDFPIFELKANGSEFTTDDFRFVSTTSSLAEQVPSLRPMGASRSADISDAFSPLDAPTPLPRISNPRESMDVERLLALAVDAQETPTAIRLARLEGVAVIDDLGHARDSENTSVTNARIDARDADAAIELYEKLFGREGERAGEVRGVLQGALDGYLANTRARRVVGFELRRFVKNRPSTMLRAYQTLESLDSLFRYHRGLGLSPGEFRRIQRSWLRQIQPDGISLDELSEAIHPSRYVRGSDILDIFGK